MLRVRGVDWGSVGSVPRPLIALLIGTVAFFALWMTALKPSSSSQGGQGLGTYQSAINKACGVPGLQHAEGCAHAGQAPAGTPGASTAPRKSTAGASTAPGQRTTGNTTPGAAGTGATSPSTTSQSHSHAASSARRGAKGMRAQASASAPTGFAAVQAGLREHKVLALLVYNPAAADDRAVHQELASVPTHRGAVVKVAVPIQGLSRYSTLLNEVPVNFSPTLVLIDRARQADEIVGFADTFEIDQRVAQALATHR
jgi:hypothetical protein